MWSPSISCGIKRSVTPMCFYSRSERKSSVHKIHMQIFFVCSAGQHAKKPAVFQQRPIYQHVAQQAVGSSSETLVLRRKDCWTQSTFLAFSLSSSSPPLPLFCCCTLLFLSVFLYLLCFSALFNKETNTLPIICKLNMEVWFKK